MENENIFHSLMITQKLYDFNTSYFNFKISRGI